MTRSYTQFPSISRLNPSAIGSGSRLRCRFGQLQTNNHSAFGVRRLVAAMVPGVRAKAATSRRTPYRTRYLSVHPRVFVVSRSDSGASGKRARGDTEQASAEAAAWN